MGTFVKSATKKSLLAFVKQGKLTPRFWARFFEAFVTKDELGEFASNGDIDHGALSGKSDDDHTQYLLASQAGSRTAFTTNWTDLTDAGDTSLHIHDSRYYTETELNAGQLDNRYYTETELDAGQLDNRYYTETEADAKYLPLTAGSGKPLSGDLYVEVSSAPSKIVLNSNGAAGDETTFDGRAGILRIRQSSNSSANILVNPEPSGANNAYVNFFDETDVSGTCALRIYDGASSPSIQHTFNAGTGDVDLCQQGGDVTIHAGDLAILDGQEFITNDGGAAITQLTSYGVNCQFIGRHANGSEASPTDTTINDLLFVLAGRGYANSTFTSSTALIKMVAAENFGAAAEGTDIVFETTGIGSTSRNKDMTFRSDGSLIVGDTAADGVLIDPVNGIYLYGSATAWDDLRVAADTTKLAGSKDPGYAVFKTNGAGSQGVFTYWFNKNTEEEVYFSIQMPHSWKEGSDIEPHVHWVPASTAAGAGTDVCWGLEYTWSNINGTFGNTTIVYADEQNNGPTETITVDKHYLTDFAAISGTGKTMSSMLICRLFRDATGAGGTDDYDDDAGLLEFDIHYQIDSFGSDDEYTKGP